MRNIFDLEGPLIGGLTKIGDCICLSVFWLVFSLPVVTLGASSAALYSAVHHCLGRGEAGVWKKFWTAFQENFKRSTLAWLIELVVLALLFADAGVPYSIFRGKTAIDESYGLVFQPPMIVVFVTGIGAQTKKLRIGMETQRTAMDGHSNDAVSTVLLL